MVQLTPDQIQALRELEDTHTIIKQEIDRAKTAGLDVSEYEAKYAALENVRAGLLKVYGAPKARRVVG
jgi:hypothetical protein